jgi:Malate synthase
MLAPLIASSHSNVVAYRIEHRRLVVSMIGGSETTLIDNERLDGFRGTPSDPSVVLLSNNGLHVEIVIDRAHAIGRTDPAGVADILLESALSTIMDMEDSVSAVDAADKIVGYRNWLGLMTGRLRDAFQKGGETVHRVLAGDRIYKSPRGGELKLPAARSCWCATSAIT